jgi:hypothetical protein
MGKPDRENAHEFLNRGYFIRERDIPGKNMQERPGYFYWGNLEG